MPTTAPRRGVPLRLEDRFARVGAVFPFVWEAPETVDPTSAVTLTLHYASGDVVVALAPLVAATVDFTAIEQRTLTPDDVADLPQLREANGRFGAGFLDVAEQGVFPVQVLRVGAADIDVGDFSSRALDGSITATLTMAVWHGEVPDRGQIDEDVRWTISFVGEGGPTVEEGLISWVRSPFSTGLTPLSLLRAVPSLTVQAPDREQDTWSAIMEGFEELVAAMRMLLVAKGLREYDLVGCPPGLRQAHIDLTIAHMLRDDPDAAERYRAQALGVFNDRFQRVGGRVREALRSVVTAGDDGEINGRGPMTGPQNGRPSTGNFARLAETRTRNIH